MKNKKEYLESKLINICGKLSGLDIDKFNSFNENKRYKIVQLLENGFKIEEVKSYSIWNK